jgi:diguanylate cyclase
MIKELFNHACIVIALLFLGGAFFRNLQSSSSVKTKLLLGISTGILGSLLMIFSIRITEYILLDLRHVAITLAVLFGGNYALIIAVVIVGISRFLFFTIGYSAYAATITLILTAIFVILINHLRISTLKKSFLMLIASTGLYATMYYVILAHFNLQTELILNIVLSYIPASIIGGLLTYYLATYIISSNSSYIELQRQAAYDYLTGLKNVRQFNRLLNEALIKTQQTKKQLALLYIDIDHFKKINDTFGHPAGDEVLKKLGRILTQNLNGGDHAFRNGGEEFSILMNNTDEKQASELAEVLREKVEQTPFYLPNGTDQYITISIGVVVSSGNKRLEEMTHEADKALYQAKNSGRNRVCITKKRVG